MRGRTKMRDVGAAVVNTPVRVLIVDDRPVVRHGLRAILENRGGFNLLIAEDLAGLFREWRSHKPHVILIGTRFGNYEAAITVGVLKDHDPQVRIVVFSQFEPDEPIVAALRSGAVGYIGIDSSPEEICTCLERVHAGKRHVAHQATRALRSSLAFGGLTERERQIIKQLPKAHTHREIAAETGLKESTVRGHMKGVLMKLNARTRQEALDVAVECGLVSAPLSLPMPSQS